MLQNIPKEKILEIVKLGPTFPSKIAKQLGNGADSMLVGAILSTLISTGEVKVSSVKIGGTPLYYSPEQESKLEEFINYLNDKDKATFRLLKEKKVLQDSTQDPLIRFSLRTIKDFAKSFEIEHNNTKIVFWRFYNISYEDAKDLAKSIITAQIRLEEEIKQEKQAETIINRPQEIILEHTTEHLKEEIKNKEQATKEIEKEHKIVKQKKDKEEQDFFEKIKTYITSKNLDIVSREKVKKTEYNLILKNHDNNEYIYCKAKDKKTISEGDLAPALIFAQNKKMTCLFIATGDLSKKAETMIHKDFSAMKFEKITN
ncbi:MAG: hypothetical protein ACP5N1_02785 [Candidatus Woesearchaeota archaeon]